jgi:hypothetical protein
MHAAVILLVTPGGEQAVQLGQRGDLASRAGRVDLDQELVTHGAVPALDFPASLRFSGLAVHQLDVEHRRRPRQLVGAVCRPVVAVQPGRAAVGLDRVVQHRLHTQRVLAVAPAVTDHIP